MEKNKGYALAEIDPALECDGKDNRGGSVPRIIFGYCEDVATWPDKPTASSGALQLDAAGALVGDVVMSNGCKAYSLSFTDNTGVFTIKPQGETGGESFLYELTVISAKVRKKILGFLNATKGRKLFIIVEDNNGLTYLMGDKGHGALLAADSDGATTGTAYTERSQTTMKFQYNCPRALVYEGDTENILTAAAGG